LSTTLPFSASAHAESEKPDQVRSIADSLGLKHPRDQWHYAALMEQRFGKHGSRFMDACDRQMASDTYNPEPLYRRLAKIPEMARLVSAHQYSTLYVEMGRWSTDSWHGRFPSQVIDFGCGFGLLTALLARLHPGSQFIGIDRDASVVAAARRIDAAHPTRNLTFQKSNSGASQLRAPMVLAVCVTHEMFGAVVANAKDAPPFARDIENARSLSAYVEPGGMLITVNRFPYPEQELPRLNQLLADEGLNADGEPTELVVGSANNRLGRPERLPIQAYRKAP
jgi:SAM-dependent methyltransferase